LFGSLADAELDEFPLLKQCSRVWQAAESSEDLHNWIRFLFVSILENVDIPDGIVHLFERICECPRPRLRVIESALTLFSGSSIHFQATIEAVDDANFVSLFGESAISVIERDLQARSNSMSLRLSSMKEGSMILVLEGRDRLEGFISCTSIFDTINVVEVELNSSILSAAHRKGRDLDMAIDSFEAIALFPPTSEDHTEFFEHIGFSQEFAKSVLNVPSQIFNLHTRAELVQVRVASLLKDDPTDPAAVIRKYCTGRLAQNIDRLAKSPATLMNPVEWLHSYVLERSFILSTPCFPTPAAMTAGTILMTSGRVNRHEVPIVALANDGDILKERNNVQYHPHLLGLEVALPNAERWYHGTSRQYADNIVQNGIRLRLPNLRSNLDFSFTPSLHVSDDFESAANWALWKYPDDPAVIVFELPSKDLRFALNPNKNFSSCTEEWRRMVKSFRLGIETVETESLEECKWIFGPVCGNSLDKERLGNDWVPLPLNPSKNQLSLRDPTATKFFSDSIVGVVVFASSSSASDSLGVA